LGAYAPGSGRPSCGWKSRRAAKQFARAIVTGKCARHRVRMHVPNPVTIERDAFLTKVAIADQTRIEAHAAEIITGSVPARPRGVPLSNSLRVNKPRLAAPECSTNRLRMFSRPRKWRRRVPPRSVDSIAPASHHAAVQPAASLSANASPIGIHSLLSPLLPSPLLPPAGGPSSTCANLARWVRSRARGCDNPCR
jgi:hypothetical protein